MIEDIALIFEFSDADRDLFRRSIHRLLSGSFVLRAVKDDEDIYSFIIRNRGVFEAYFECAGWTLRVDEPIGAISWLGPSPARIHFTKDETILLVIARLLYEEKKSEITLLENPVVTVSDLLGKYQSLTGVQLKKTRFYDVLRRLQTLKLLKAESSDFAPDSLVSIYPSVALALDSNAVNALHEKISRDAERPALEAPENGDDNEEEIDADQPE
jgi:hypothetical protein